MAHASAPNLIRMVIVVFSCISVNLWYSKREAGQKISAYELKTFARVHSASVGAKRNCWLDDGVLERRATLAAREIAQQSP
jgi:hypothetical protein